MKASEITVDWLTGKAETKMEVFSSVKLHPETSPAFKKLQEKAKKAGFDLQIVSGFRSFDSQLKIWNQKVKGDRPVFDLKGNKIDPNSLPAEKLIHTILRWSALPGCSRHHWGTDIDVIDRGAISADYKVQLTPEEVAEGLKNLEETDDNAVPLSSFFVDIKV
jgi:LAS superfamily LD-carboxypeptidase LdcB